MTRRLSVALLSLLIIVSMIPLAVAQQMGPEIDRLRFKVIKSPDPELIGMQTCEIDVLTDLIRTGDIEKLDGDGFTITSAPGFHMGFIGINVRPDQSYKEPAHGSPIAGPVLSDANFRHALFHCYNQEEIVASVYKYIVTPVQSLVPPALGGWGNPDVPKHPYNPGDPEASTVYDPETKEHADSCSILRYGGYEYDAEEGNWLTPYDLDGVGGRDYIPTLKVFTPTYEVAPTSAEHGARFVEDCNRIGIPLYHDPREFAPYLDLVFGTEGVPGGEFDLFMVFYSLGRFPDHLYDQCHSSQDTKDRPGAYNGVGIHSDELDEAVETIKFSLDHEEKMEAAHHAQYMLYDPDNYPECACSYMLLYSRIYFNAFKPGLTGVVNSPGYGSDNSWTFLNMRWVPGHPNERIEDGESTIIWCLGEEPERHNPCYGHTVYVWEIMGSVMDGLMAVNPYSHEDLPWLAVDWEIQKWATEEDVDKLLANTVTVTDEAVGTGDNITTTFNLDNCHVVPPSVTVYLDEVVTTEYVLNYTSGEITFATAPEKDVEITADYTYVYLLGAECKGSHWHEDWPTWSTNWRMHSWTDDDVSGTLTVGDQVDFEGDVTDDEPPVQIWYNVTDITWDIKVERKVDPYDEMKLSGTGAPRPPDEILAGDMEGTTWHEEWPTRSTTWTCNDFTDNGDGILSRSDEIMLDGTWWHVDSVTVTLHLDEKPVDGELDKVVEFAGTGMKLLYWLREDVYWQCGNQFTAQDVAFNWLFLRDNEIPRYMSTWEHLVDAVTVGPDGAPHFKVVAYLEVTSQFLLYDFAGIGAILPPPVWGWLDGKPLTEILAYDPANNLTKPADAGPRFGTDDCPTQLYGTGAYIFEYYDPVGMYAELHANRNYWKSTQSIRDEKATMFHRIGDVDWNGEVFHEDKTLYSLAYGCTKGETCYNANADLNDDEIVDALDGILISFYYGEKKEYP